MKNNSKKKFTSRSKTAHQRGASMIAMLTMVGLLGLVAGGTMLTLGDTILDTAKDGDESAHASRLGDQRDVRSGGFFSGGSGVEQLAGGEEGDRLDVPTTTTEEVTGGTAEVTPVTHDDAPSAEVAYEPLDPARRNEALGIPADYEGTPTFVEGAEYEVADLSGGSTPTPREIPNPEFQETLDGLSDFYVAAITRPDYLPENGVQLSGGPFERNVYIPGATTAGEIGEDGEPTGRRWNPETGEIEEFTEGLFGYSEFTWGLDGWAFSPGRFTPGFRTTEQDDAWIVDTSGVDALDDGNGYDGGPRLSFWADEPNEAGIYTIPWVSGVMEGSGVAPIAGLVSSGMSWLNDNAADEGWRGNLVTVLATNPITGPSVQGIISGGIEGDWGERFARDTHIVASGTQTGRDMTLVTGGVMLFADVVTMGATSVRNAPRVGSVFHLADDVPTLPTAVLRADDVVPPPAAVVQAGDIGAVRAAVADARITTNGPGPRMYPVEQGNFRYAMADEAGTEIGSIQGIIRTIEGEPTLLITVKVDPAFQRAGAAPRLYQHLDQEGLFQHVHRGESHLEWDNAARFNELASEARAAGMTEADALRHAANNFPTSRQWTDRGWTAEDVRLTESGPEIVWRGPTSPFEEGLTPHFNSPKLDGDSQVRLQEIARADMPDADYRVTITFDDGFTQSQTINGTDLSGMLDEVAESGDITGLTIRDGAPDAIAHSQRVIPEIEILPPSANVVSDVPLTNGAIGDLVHGKAPHQVTPGVRVLQGQHVNDVGRVEPWTAHYDEYGRLQARTDYNAANPAHGIDPIHSHTYQWGPGMNPLETSSHVPGPWQPQ